MKRSILTLMVIAQMLFGVDTAVFAGAVTETDRPAIEAMVKDYLLAHPEVIEQVLAELDARQQQEASNARSTQVDALKTKLFDSARQINLGNTKGDVTVVEFFDYNCTYCRHALPDMVTMLKGDTKLRFVLKEWPVLGPDSVEAARVAEVVEESPLTCFGRQPDGQSRVEEAVLVHEGADARSRTGRCSG